MNTHRIAVPSFALAATFALTIATSVSATPILSPVSAAASSTGAGDIVHTIDHTGLQTNFVSGVTDFDTYIAGNPQHDGPGPANAWSALIANAPINLDYGLGGTFDIDRLALWTSFDGFSINRFTVFTATDAGFLTAVNVGSFSANDTNPVVPQVFALAPSVGSFLRVQVLSDQGSASVNLSELAVRAAPAAVPEPATLVLFGSGLVAAGVRRLRRRRQ